MQATPISAKPAASSSVGTGEDFRARQEREVEVNYKAFQARLDELLRSHAGKYALMHNGEITECYDKLKDALKTGHLLYKGDVFSVQRVNIRPADLGLRRPPILRGRSPKFSDAAPMTAAGGGK